MFQFVRNSSLKTMASFSSCYFLPNALVSSFVANNISGQPLWHDAALVNEVYDYSANGKYHKLSFTKKTEEVGAGHAVYNHFLLNIIILIFAFIPSCGLQILHDDYFLLSFSHFFQANTLLIHILHLHSTSSISHSHVIFPFITWPFSGKFAVNIIYQQRSK